MSNTFQRDNEHDDGDDIDPTYYQDNDAGQRVAAKIRAIYDAGTPFYPRDKIQDLSQQLEEARLGERSEAEGGHQIKVISATGIDGVKLEFDYEIGQVVDSSEPDRECTLYVL
jgi:hypothetical protein